MIPEIVEADLRDGQHRNPDPITHPEFFTTAYLHLPIELESEAREASLPNMQLFAIEGIGSALDNDDDLASQLYAARATEFEPALLGASAHIMLSATSPPEE